MTVIYSEKAKKRLSKLDKQVKNRIDSYMSEVAGLKDPRSRGKELVGNLKNFYRYRVGDYRIICEIRDAELVIIVVEIGHRREVYKK